MNVLLAANPKKKRKGKVPPALAAYWAKHRRKKGGHSSRKTARKKARSTSRKRRTGSGRVTVVTVNRNPAPAHKPRKARKYISAAKRFGGKIGGLIPSEIVPAAIGAAGALAIDAAWTNLPFIPDTLKTGPLAPVTRVGLAVGLGIVAGKVKGRAFGRQVAIGALTVTGYDLLKNWMQANVPGIPLQMYDRRSPLANARPALGYYGSAPAALPGAVTYAEDEQGDTFD